MEIRLQRQREPSPPVKCSSFRSRKVRELVCVLSRFSHVRFFATLWTVACQALLPRGFSRQEYYSMLSFPFPDNLLNPGIEPMSLESPVLAGSLPLVPPGTNVQLASEETHELSLWVTLTSEYTFHVWMRKAKEVLKNTFISCIPWRAIPCPPSKHQRRFDSL